MLRFLRAPHLLHLPRRSGAFQGAKLHRKRLRSKDLRYHRTSDYTVSMFSALRRPLPLPLLIGAFAGATIVVTLYCIVYTTLSGRGETFSEALGWALANICPWLVAIEAGKRASGRVTTAGILVIALTVSLGLGYLLGSSGDALPFEAARRLPALAASGIAIAILRSTIGQKSRSQQLRLLPSQIDWIRAAGNYVEVRAAGRTVVERASIGSLEREFATHGFVRIHRSLLVRRDCIARVRRKDVVLHDGTHLPLGKRYRASLAA